jgi:hypothetical protein
MRRPEPVCAALGIALLFSACAARATPPQADPERIEVRAPIVRVSVRVAESFPPQYFADVRSALPDGCTRFARFAVRREGSIVYVDVFNTRPRSEDVMCTMIYGEHESAARSAATSRPAAATRWTRTARARHSSRSSDTVGAWTSPSPPGCASAS